MNVFHVKSNTIADFTGTVTVFDSNGLTKTAQASALVRPTDWNSAHVMAQTLVGNTAGASTVSGTNLALSGGPGVTLSGDGTRIGMSVAPQSLQTQGSVLVQGSSGAIVFSNSNGVSFGGNASTVTASVAAQSAQTLGIVASSQTVGESSSSTFDARSLSVIARGLISAGMSAGALLLSATAPAQTIQTQSTVAIQGSTGAISFSNSNGITFGFNASTITASHNGLTTAAASNHSHGNPTLALTNLSGTTASNSAGLTISLSAAAGGGGADGGVGLSAGTQSVSTGTVAFANSNGISFGMSGSSQITASYTVPSTAGLLSAVNISAGTTSQNLSAVTFGNANGVSFGLNGSVVTASITPAGGAQTGISGIANSETTYTSGSVTFSALGALTIRSTTGQHLQFSVNPQSTQPVAVSAANGSYAFSTLTFSNANGVSFGTSAGSAITASVAAQSAQPGIQSISAGTTRATTGEVVFSNSNGLSFGLNGNTLTASYTVPTVTNSSWTVSDAASSATVARLAFTNLNGVTLSLSSGAGGSHTIVGSHNALTSQSNQAVSAANGSSTFQTLSFANGGGVSWSTVAGGIQATVATNYLTTAALSDHSHGNPTLALTNLSGTTASASNGLTLSLSAAAPVAQTAQTIGVYASSQTYGQSSSSTVDARSFTMVGSGGISIGLSAGSILVSGQTTTPQTVQPGIQTIAFANTTFTTGAVSFSNANGFSFGSSGGQVTASYTVPNVPAQTAQTLGVYGSSQTTGQSSSSTVDARSLSFRGAGIVSVGMSAGEVLISATAAAGGGGGIAAAAGTQTATSGTVAFVNSNGLTFGMSGSTQITASHNGLTTQTVQTQSNVQGISAGTQVGRTGDIVFSNSNGITFGMSGSNTVTASHNGITSQSNQVLSLFAVSNTTQSSSGTANATALSFAGAGIASVGVTGGTVVVSVPSGGGGGGIVLANSQTTYTSGTVFISEGGGAITVASTTGQAFRLSVPATSSLSATGQVSISVNGSTISIGVPNRETRSGHSPYGDREMMTGQQQGVGSVVIDPVFMPNVQFDRVVIPVFNTNSSNSSGSHSLSFNVGFYTRNGSTLSLLASASGSRALTHSGTVGSYSLFSGMRAFTVPMTRTLTEGQYWLAIQSSSASAGANGSYSMGHLSNVASNFLGHFGSSHATTAQITLGQGVYTAATAAMPGSIAFSQIRGSDSIALRPAIVSFASGTV